MLLNKEIKSSKPAINNTLHKVLFILFLPVLAICFFVYFFWHDVQAGLAFFNIYLNRGEIISSLEKAKPAVDSSYIFDLSPIEKVLYEHDEDIAIISEHFAKTRIIQKIAAKKITPTELNFINKFLINYLDIKISLNSLLSKNQKILIIFQNSDELRPNGGFMGSYAIINVENKKISEIIIEDIYDASGQFEGYIEAPSGVKEFLSSNNGLKLQDANWDANFDDSAKKILQFFALGGHQNISTVITINSNSFGKILEILGPIYISDYKITIDHTNFQETLRSTRDDFFAGSTQKKHLIKLAFNQLKEKILHLDKYTILSIINTTQTEIKNYEIQFFSNNIELNKIFSKNKMKFTLASSDNSNYDQNQEFLYFAEANVGINKANKKFKRNVELFKEKNQLKLIINFENDNEKITTPDINDHMSVVNYFRIFYSDNLILGNAFFDNLPIEIRDDNQINIKNNVEEKAIFFVVREKEKKQLVLNFELKQNYNKKLVLQKQSGIYNLRYNTLLDGKYEEFTLENDKILDW